jgi:deoxyribonuclease V
MKIAAQHWPETVEEAIAVQNELRHAIRLNIDPPSLLSSLKTIAGVDVSHDRQDKSHAAIVIMDAQSLDVLEQVKISAPTRFPYVPGFLSFREIPVILDALAQLSIQPDILMVDGQGIAHPRRLGIAAHLGVLLDMPAAGVAKSRLWGRYEDPGPNKGDFTPLKNKGETIGYVVRSKAKCLPLFVSPGHRLDVDSARDLTIRFLTRYRLPEPTRLADRLSKQK